MDVDLFTLGIHHNIVETTRKRGAKTKPPTTPLKMPAGEGGGGAS